MERERIVYKRDGQEEDKGKFSPMFHNTKSSRGTRTTKGIRDERNGSIPKRI